MELRTLLDWVVNYQLRSVPGVVEVNSFGGELKTYQVTLDPDRLDRLRALAVGDVSRRPRREQPQRRRRLHRAPAASSTSIRGEGWSSDFEDLGEIVLSQR